jgi:hypothetical protein
MFIYYSTTSICLSGCAKSVWNLGMQAISLAALRSNSTSAMTSVTRNTYETNKDMAGAGQPTSLITPSRRKNIDREIVAININRRHAQCYIL